MKNISVDFLRKFWGHLNGFEYYYIGSSLSNCGTKKRSPRQKYVERVVSSLVSENQPIKIVFNGTNSVNYIIPYIQEGQSNPIFYDSKSMTLKFSFIDYLGNKNIIEIDENGSYDILFRKISQNTFLNMIKNFRLSVSDQFKRKYSKLRSMHIKSTYKDKIDNIKVKNKEDVSLILGIIEEDFDFNYHPEENKYTINKVYDVYLIEKNDSWGALGEDYYIERLYNILKESLK